MFTEPVRLLPCDPDKIAGLCEIEERVGYQLGRYSSWPIVSKAFVKLVEVPMIPRAKLPAKGLELFLVSLSFQIYGLGQRNIHMIMHGYVIHGSALREQIIDFTKIGISDNFRYPVLA